MIKPARAANQELIKFDRVEIAEESGQRRTLQRGEFQALKLDERVRYILGKRVKFYMGEREVPLKDALVK